MDALNWSKSTFKNEKLQNYLEEKVRSLLKGPLRNHSDYAQEKCIKSFCEGLGYLESVLLYQREIHPHKLELSYWQGREEEYKKYWLEVEGIILNSINRQFRHFLEFLSLPNKDTIVH
ncbi:hypothetical protein [Bacillus sp. FJAT-29937]|uniref:hypothetical protein n=1 Tax=Bacillus sp. FJAT-29937 TaxID=1720553 RepID=UPI00082B982F|nr:hypothetical protein [Bacillus sp. FJAT-29937]